MKLALTTLILIAAASSCAGNQPSGPEVLSKSAELDRAQGGPSASQINGNANKWAGQYVHFPCKIINVIQDAQGDPEANAECGAGVTAQANLTEPNIDYSDPDAVQRAMAQEARAEQSYVHRIGDQAMIVLEGSKVANLDGDQIITVTGPVLGAVEGKNGFGVTMNYTVVRVDYAD